MKRILCEVVLQCSHQKKAFKKISAYLSFKKKLFIFCTASLSLWLAGKALGGSGERLNGLH